LQIGCNVKGQAGIVFQLHM